MRGAFFVTVVRLGAVGLFAALGTGVFRAVFFVTVVRLGAVGLFAALGTGVFRAAFFGTVVWLGAVGLFAALGTGALGLALVAAAFATPFFAVLRTGAFFARVFFVDDG